MSINPEIISNILGAVTVAALLYVAKTLTDLKIEVTRIDTKLSGEMSNMAREFADAKSSIKDLYNENKQLRDRLSHMEANGCSRVEQCSVVRLKS